MKVSVIVPVYNVEKYLKKCINSILNQTYENLEIILVDDGSTDSSSVICDEYAKKTDRIRVFHKTNGGLSDARNFGIDKSTGKYLCFIDADDYIEPTMIEKLYNTLIDEDADISCCGKAIEYGEKTLFKNNVERFCVSNIEALARMFTFREIDNSPCDKLYKKELFKDIKFPFGKYYEDMGTTYKVILNAKKIAHIPDIGYHYILRNGSISNQSFTNRHFDSLFFAKEAKDYIVFNYPTIEQEVCSYYYLELANILQKIRKSNNSESFKQEYRKIKKEYNSLFTKMMVNRYITFVKKIMLILIYFNMFKLVEIIKWGIKI